jgi:hypothetical protein
MRLYNLLKGWGGILVVAFCGGLLLSGFAIRTAGAVLCGPLQNCHIDMVCGDDNTVCYNSGNFQTVNMGASPADYKYSFDMFQCGAEYQVAIYISGCWFYTEQCGGRRTDNCNY